MFVRHLHVPLEIQPLQLFKLNFNSQPGPIPTSNTDSCNAWPPFNMLHVLAEAVE